MSICVILTSDDPMPKPLVVNCIYSLLLVIKRIVNLSLSSGYFSNEWKCAIVINPYLTIDLSVIFSLYVNLRKGLYMNKSIFTLKRTICVLYSNLRTENNTVQKLLL